jgi:hypothetical protein
MIVRELRRDGFAVVFRNHLVQKTGGDRDDHRPLTGD